MMMSVQRQEVITTRKAFTVLLGVGLVVAARKAHAMEGHVNTCALLLLVPIVAPLPGATRAEIDARLSVPVTAEPEHSPWIDGIS